MLHDCRCDRILWYGTGIEQLSYCRGESNFSDHRPVSALFIAEIEVLTPTNSKTAELSKFFYSMNPSTYDVSILNLTMAIDSIVAYTESPFVQGENNSEEEPERKSGDEHKPTLLSLIRAEEDE